MGGDLNFDIHFTTVGGIGGIADTCQLYRVLGIPVAVIADLDLLTDTAKIERILEILCLRVGQGDALPSAKDRLSTEKMSEYRTIVDEGDGMKSYVATCVSILLGRRPVSVIDEPEMCLHPPQAYNLGQFIGDHASSQQTATFVATHSSQVLRGIIQTAYKLKIVRLSKTEEGFHSVCSGHAMARCRSSAIEAEPEKRLFWLVHTGPRLRSVSGKSANSLEFCAEHRF